MNYKAILNFARENRKNQTESEKIFWENVRNRKCIGLKFNRQFIIEYRLISNLPKYFIADFYCDQYKLIIEFDGKIHDFKKDYDLERDEILKAQGYKVLHIKNETIINNWEFVENEIKKLIF